MPPACHFSKQPGQRLLAAVETKKKGTNKVSMTLCRGSRILEEGESESKNENSPSDSRDVESFDENESESESENYKL